VIDDETKEAIRRSDERRERFRRDLEAALAHPDNTMVHPRPWTCSMIIHDGPGAQFFDANGMPVLSDPIREPEDAAQLLHSINSGL
jgi:hypothetical protein